MRLERKDVRAVEQGLISLGVVREDPINQFVLTQHTAKMGRVGAALQQNVGREQLKARGQRGDV
jgi:hypothetical protein